MWINRLLKLLSKEPTVEQSDFEKTKEALKPTKSRTNPPKPLAAPPKIEKRVSSNPTFLNWAGLILNPLLTP